MRRRFPAISIPVFVLLGMAAALTSPAGPAAAADTSTLIAPAQVPGIAVYVPYDVSIKIDGKLNDWAKIPVQTVDYGPKTASDFLENGQFQFQVAADQTNLYITASAVDRTIIAGKHGGAYWNEDSLEFYLNTSGDLNSTTYGDHIWQVNINAADIGKTNPDGLTLTGVNSDKIHVRGLVFKTTEPNPGWGYEVAIPMSDLGITPTSGLEIGFSAQMNDASVQDRDGPGGVQLNWSKADTNNTSYQDPSKFGTAIFFKVGQTEVPTPFRIAPTPTPRPTAPPPQVSVNQIGYYPSGPKIASYSTSSKEPQAWRLLDSTGAEVATGQTTVVLNDTASGGNVHQIDFSSFTKAGSDYTLDVGGVASDKFKISDDLYTGLKKDALAYFYRDRSGIELLAQYAGAEWARAAGHLSDNHVTCYKGQDTTGKEWPGCDYFLDVSGGWYDAGDYGKYVVNGGISVWTLMNQYERNPKAFTDGSLNIPENKNGVPDILDEARWELKFMLGMQVPEGQQLAGMVHHKMHDDAWSSMPSMPPTQATNRYLFPPSTAATLNLAAVGAQCARIWKTIDPAFSQQCLTASEKAWTAAVANPKVYAATFNAGGGAYGDGDVTDEFYWAASELYVTTGRSTYKDFVLASGYLGKAEIPDWATTWALGTISLALIPNGLPSDRIQLCRVRITYQADGRLAFIARQGYRMPLTNFAWGSNSEALNAGMIMGLAYQFTNERKYLDGTIDALDYVLGRNPLNRSYVTGYGTTPAQHPHHRFWANQPKNGYPAPPPGAVVGGANGSVDAGDTAARDAGLGTVPAARAWVDNINSFSTNEVAINWNAPLAWVTDFVDQAQNGGVIAPPAASGSKKDEGLPIWLLVGVPVVLVVAGATVFWVWRKGRRVRAGA